MDLEGINQVQVNSEIGLTFANVLRSILRQDPNIIMIGEIRDNETARIAVRASITGHLVLSTIHTNNSLNTIERLLDMEVERYLLASALEGIVSQKLARRLCEKCRRRRPTNQYEKNLFKSVLDVEINEVYSAEGCEECANGYRGRIALHEVLLINQEIRDALAEDITKEKLRELVYKSDVTTLLQDGLEKVVNGYTTCEEVLKLIELDDDIEGKTQEYRYSLNKALEESNLSKQANGGSHIKQDEITLSALEEKEETPNIQ
jgi:type IV pilus assembly protein PilB